MKRYIALLSIFILIIITILSNYSFAKEHYSIFNKINDTMDIYLSSFMTTYEKKVVKDKEKLSELPYFRALNDTNLLNEVFESLPDTSINRYQLNLKVNINKNLNYIKLVGYINSKHASKNEIIVRIVNTPFVLSYTPQGIENQDTIIFAEFCFLVVNKENKQTNLVFLQENEIRDEILENKDLLSIIQNIQNKEEKTNFIRKNMFDVRLSIWNGKQYENKILTKFWDFDKELKDEYNDEYSMKFKEFLKELRKKGIFVNRFGYGF